MTQTWQERANRVFAQGCTTYSKRNTAYVDGVYPTHISGNPCIDGHDVFADGKRFTDWTGGLGANLLDVQNNFGLPHVNEVLLAEMLQQRIPMLEKMRFLKTGSEVCQAAVRIARAWRQNEGIGTTHGIGIGYHGWHNWVIASEKPGTGTKYEGYDKYESIGEVLARIVFGGYDYVIVEPVMLDMSEEHVEKLREIRRICTKFDTVLIFDEVITGFRTPKYTMSQYLGITPDLICLGKALGNGYPIAVVGGRADMMDTPGWFVSGTHAGELSAINKAIDTLQYLDRHPIDELWAAGQSFKDRFNAITPRIQLYGLPTRSIWKAESEEYKALFWQECCKRGILFGAGWWITFAHIGKVSDDTLEICKQAVQAIEGGARLDGKIPSPVFKRV